MKKENLLLSTVDPSAAAAARRLGLGLELAEFCTAANMDEQFPLFSAAAAAELTGIRRRTLHGPFNELAPCAVDPKARALAAERYRQALDLCGIFGAEKLILHAGYQPYQYYPVWFVEQSVLFWREFLKREDPQTPIVLENVTEREPRWLLEIVTAVDDPRLRLCLDVGHAHVYSSVPVTRWLETLAPYLTHFHLHNNDGSADTHGPLFRGTIPMPEVLTLLDTLCPAATVTIESADGTENLPFLEGLA